MREVDSWCPTKVDVRADGSLIVPADRQALSSGSILIATLISRWYKRVLPEVAQGSMLEVGCGQMPFYGMYRQRVREVLCTDWPNSAHSLRLVDFFSDLSSGLPIQDACVDTLLASDVLEHMSDPSRALAEIFRVLRPGGAALINTPFMYGVHEAPYDFFRYTQYGTRRLGEDAGFIIDRLDTLGGPVCVLADVAGKMLNRVPVIGSLLASALQRLTLKLHSHWPQSATYPLVIGAVFRKPA